MSTLTSPLSYHLEPTAIRIWPFHALHKSCFLSKTSLSPLGKSSHQLSVPSLLCLSTSFGSLLKILETHFLVGCQETTPTVSLASHHLISLCCFLLILQTSKCMNTSGLSPRHSSLVSGGPIHSLDLEHHVKTKKARVNSLLDSRLVHPAPPLKCIICKMKLLIFIFLPICSPPFLQMKIPFLSVAQPKTL